VVSKTDIEDYLYGQRDRLTKSFPPLSGFPKKKDTREEIKGLQERSAKVKEKMEHVYKRIYLR
jgi:hypothetical protein